MSVLPIFVSKRDHGKYLSSLRKTAIKMHDEMYTHDINIVLYFILFYNSTYDTLYGNFCFDKDIALAIVKRKFLKYWIIQ